MPEEGEFIKIFKYLNDNKQFQEDQQIQFAINDLINIHQNRYYLQNSEFYVLNLAENNSNNFYYKKRLLEIQGKISRFFGVNTFSENEVEIQLHNIIKELLEFFEDKKEQQQKQNQEQQKESLDDKEVIALSQQEIEEELLSSVGHMKQFALMFTDHLKEDDKQLQKLKQVQQQSSVAVKSSLDEIFNFEQMSKNLGYFQLIKMAVIAIGLFIVTMSFIFFDSFLF